jgi:hypothetical protein
MRNFIRVFVSAATFTLLFILTTALANAAVVTWDGGGGIDTNWSTGANWSTDSVPGVDDIATFDNTSDNNSKIDAGFAGSIGGIDINSGYDGEIIQQRSLTIGDSHYNQVDGTFTGATQDITLSGNFVLSAGAFTSTSGNFSVGGNWTHTAGGSFVHNSGTVKATGNGKTFDFDTPTGSGVFHHFTIDNGDADNWFYFGAGDTATVEGTLSLLEGFLNNTNMYFDAKGNIVLGASCVRMAFPITMTGSEDQTITDIGGDLDSTLTVNKSGGTVRLGANLSISAGFTLTAGTVEFVTYDASVARLDIDGGSFNGGSGDITTTNGSVGLEITDGTLTATSGTMDLSGAWTHSAGGDFAHNNGTVILRNSTITFDDSHGGAGEFYNLDVNRGGSGNWFYIYGTGADTIVVGNNLDMTSGFLNNAGNFTVAGNWTIGNLGASITPVTLNGTGTQEVDATGYTDKFNADITVNKATGEVRLVSDLKMDASDQDLTIAEGTFDLNNYDLDINDQANSDFDIEDGGIMKWRGTETLAANSGDPTLASGSTVKYAPTAGSVTIQDWAYHHLDAAADTGATVQLGAVESLAGNLVITSGNFYTNGYGLTVTGNVVNESVFKLQGAEAITLTNGNDTNTGTVEYVGDGNAAQTDYTLKDWTYFNLKADMTDGADTLTDSQSVRTVNGYFRLNSGVYTATSGTMSIGGYMADYGGVYNHNDGNVTITGGGLFEMPDTLYNLTINASGNTATLGANTIIEKDLTITAGTLDASEADYNLTVGRYFTNNGAFTPRSGTVFFNTAGETTLFTGDTTFNNVTCITAGKTLQFTGGSTQTVNGILTLTGAEGNRIVLNSNPDATTWYLNANGTESVSYVDVWYSDASGGNTIDPGDDSNDGGGNTGWSFNDVPTAATLSVSQVTDGSGDVSISFVIDDPDADDTCQVKVEYSVNGGITWADPTVSTTASELTATYGTPSVDNAQTYQVGQAAGYVTTSSGANTLTIIWEAATDVANSTDITNAKVRVTPYDGTAAGAVLASSDFVLDVVAPTGPTTFTNVGKADKSASFQWGQASDTNFDHYEIWYSSFLAEVQNRNGYATEFDSDDDTDMAVVTTTDASIVLNNPYNRYFAVYAVDAYGNATMATVLQVLADGDSVGFFGITVGVGASSNSSADVSDDSVEEDEDSEDLEEEEAESEEGIEGLPEREFMTFVRPELGAIEVEVPDHWSREYLKYLGEDERVIEEVFEEEEFFEVVEEIFFDPDAKITRIEALRLMMVLGGHHADGTEYTGVFDDIDEGHNWMEELEYAYKNDLVEGYPDGTFRPDQEINRVEALKMATKFYGWNVRGRFFGDELLGHYLLDEVPFLDVDMEAWYAPYVIPATAYTIVRGYGELFMPASFVTNAEFVKLAALLRDAYYAVDLASELDLEY